MTYATPSVPLTPLELLNPFKTFVKHLALMSGAIKESFHEISGTS